MDFVNRYFSSVWTFVEAMAPYLVLGLLLAGIMHVFLPKDFIYKHLAKKGLGSVFKGSLLGVPMPLCSCSVIPVAQHIHKSGASKGATLSFVSSTPSTGVDSISALWGLMGPIYTLFKVILAFLGGWITGFIVSWVDSTDEQNKVERPEEPKFTTATTVNPSSISMSFGDRLKSALSYGFIDLFEDFAKWLFIGTMIGGALEFILPANLGMLENVWLSYLIVVVVSMPLYVCATGSIPLALALLAQGFSPGSALIFLTLGPVSNAATFSWLWGNFGVRITAIYFSVLASLSIASAYIMDLFFRDQVLAQSHLHNHESSALWVTLLSIAFTVLWIYHLLKPLRKKWMKSPKIDSIEFDDLIQVPISGMTCGNCQAKVEGILSKHEIQAQVNLEENTVELTSSSLTELKGISALLAMQGYVLDFERIK